MRPGADLKMIRGRLTFSCLLLAAILWIAPPEAAAQQINREWELKASYMYYFTQYIAWPEGHAAEGPFVIGILGRNPFGSYSRRLEALTAPGGRRIVVRQFDSLEDYEPCHILFISRSGITNAQAQRRLEAAREATEDSHVLLVSDSPGLAERGAAFNFFVTGNRLKIQFNEGVTEDAGLQVEARLANLASVVKVHRDRN